MIVVIDGLSGSGKSSTAKAVAKKLGIQYLDSGALYRTATFIWLHDGKRLTENQFIDILESKDIEFEFKNDRFLVFLNGRNITSELRRQSVSDNVSMVAAMPGVRRFLNDLMRKAVSTDDYIADGRDLGSVVFPDAEFKFFMKASLDERARRRYKELESNGESVSLGEVEQNLDKRDRKDLNRTVDPLIKPDDAVEIDTTRISFDEQVDKICSIIAKEIR